MFFRTIDLKAQLNKKSCFLFGPRATGKSFWIKETLKKVKIIDLLDNHIYMQLLARPSLLEEIIGNNKLVVIDEIQKIPALLDEVHRLIENRNVFFLLTGSSARKLKNGGANLLAGRARGLELFPLTSQEIKEFNIIQYCQIGGLPLINLSDMPWIDLRDYVTMYLKEEIQAEALVRRLDSFSRFLDTFGSRSGEELNYKSIADDSMVPERTVASYIEVLKDTLIAYELTPFKGPRRKTVTRSKLYFFDVGVANYLAGRKNLEFKSRGFGEAFEHFVLQELRAYISYHFIDEPMCYWRTVDQYEVDCVVGEKIAFEIKASSNIQNKHLKGLRKLQEESVIERLMLISFDKTERDVDGIELVYIDTFLERLWKGEYLQS